MNAHSSEPFGQDLAAKVPSFSSPATNERVMTTFGEIFTWVRTNNLSREHLSDEPAGDIQNIHYGDIHSKYRAQFRQSEECVPYINVTAPGSVSSSEYLKEGDVVIADASEDYADVGKSIEIMEVDGSPLVAGLHTYVARPKAGKIAPGFAGYLLQSAAVRAQIIRAAQGISVLGISKKNLEKVVLLLPTPDEQRRIAGTLSAVDAKIDALKAKKSALEDYKRGLMQKLFSREIRFTREDGTAFPQWTERRLGDVLEQPLRQPVVDYYERELLTVRLHCNGIAATGKQPRKTQSARPYYVRRAGELLVGRQNFHNGGFGIVPAHLDGFIASNAISSYRVASDEVSLDFIVKCLSRHDYYRKVEDLIGGTGQKEISHDEFVKLKVFIPSLEEQRLILNAIVSIEDKISATDEHLKTVQAFKKGLLQKLFV